MGDEVGSSGQLGLRGAAPSCVFVAVPSSDSSVDVETRSAELTSDGMQEFVVATSLPAFGVGLESWLDDPVRRWRVRARCRSAIDTVVPASKIDKPCVVATDELDGVLLGNELRRQVPRAVLLMLSSGQCDTREAELVRAGASGVLSLTADRRDVVRAVSDLLRGGTVVSAGALRLLAGEPADATELTSRQQDVLRLLGEGLSSTEIASRLMLAPSTVKTHISRMGERLGLSGQRALALNAATLLGPAHQVSLPAPPINVTRSGATLVGTSFGHGAPP